MDQAQQPGTSSLIPVSTDVKRPEKVQSYRLNFWNDIVTEDTTSEIMNVVGMLMSMVGILLKYKTCAWFGILVAGIGYANSRSNSDGKQIMSSLMLSLSGVIMCYITNPQPISVYFGQQQLSPVADVPLDSSTTSSAATGTGQ